MTKLVPPCEVKPGDKPIGCKLPGYRCHYCGEEIPPGRFTSRGREIGDTSGWYTVCTSHTVDVLTLEGIEQVGWIPLEVPDVTTDSVAIIKANVPPDVSEPMSEVEAIEWGKKGVWVVCITPGKTRYRKWVRAL